MGDPRIGLTVVLGIDMGLKVATARTLAGLNLKPLEPQTRNANSEARHLEPKLQTPSPRLEPTFLSKGRLGLEVVGAQAGLREVGLLLTAEGLWDYRAAGFGCTV